MMINPIISGKMPARHTRIDSDSAQRLRMDIAAQAIRRIGIFELVWYPLFFLGGLAALLTVSLMKSAFSWLLIISVLELWLMMTASNLIAKGKRIGFIISVVAMLAYVFVSFVTAVWGEAIINLALYIPLEIYAYFAWKKSVDKQDTIDSIRSVKLSGVLFWIGVLIAGSTLCFLILHLVLGQHYALLNSISIMAFLVGTLIRNRRHKFFWYFYMLGNLSGLAMWTLIAVRVDISALPMIISFLATLSNNFNGLFVWNKLYRTNRAPQGVLLAENPIKIERVVRFKRAYQKLTHQMSRQPDQRIKET